MSANTIVHFSFSPENMLTATEIMEYFEEIGEQINSVRLYAESTPCYGFAKFRRSSSVQRVLKRQNCIRGATLTVFEHPYGSDSYEEVSGTSILWLNDDCLEKVFGFLNENDLCSVADTCKRFKYNAQSEYQRHRSHTSLCYSKSLPNLLRNFGAFVESLVIHRPAHFDRLVKFIARYCGPSLTTLRLFGVLIQDDDTIQFLRPIFSQLQFLSICRCESSFNTLLSSSLMLRELQIVGNENIASSLQRNFPQMKAIKLSSSGLETEDVINFLKWNPQLKSLKSYEPDGTILEAIVQHVPQIEAIKFNPRKNEPKLFENLKQLQALHTVTIVDNDGDDDILNNQIIVEDLIDELVAAKLPITTFRLSACTPLTEIIASGISELQSIKTLDYCGRFYDTTELPLLIDICKSLPDLADLRLTTAIGCEVFFAFEIIQLISCAKKLTSLVICNFKIELLDDETKKQIADIIAKRSEKNHLEIILESKLMKYNFHAGLSSQTEISVKMFSPNFD